MKTIRSGAGAATLAYKAPEAFDDEFSTASEVYAYGIIGWEVLTGNVPWEGYSELKLIKDVAILGKRLPLPPNIVTAPLGQMVQRWWAQEHTKRPVFAEIVTQLVEAVKYIPINQSVEVRLPGTWSAVDDVQLAQMVPVGVGAERKEVEAAFGRTLAGRGIQVVQVLRVQNVEMWKTFAIKRQLILEREAGADALKVEQRFERRWLFHGTDTGTASKIVAQGFNRSFCGKNMTKYGKGVYFARDSCFASSPTYATPNAEGTQCMFLCRVVVGEYCRGVQNALTPATRNGNMLFDTTVDDMAHPSIYVTYHDAQAYPEYLVRFRS